MQQCSGGQDFLLLVVDHDLRTRVQMNVFAFNTEGNVSAKVTITIAAR